MASRSMTSSSRKPLPPPLPLTYTCNGNTIDFTDASPGCPSTWGWAFGDPGSGGLNATVSQNPSHTYPGPGNYLVSFSTDGPCSVPSSIDITIGILGVTVASTDPTCTGVPGSATATIVGGRWHRDDTLAARWRDDRHHHRAHGGCVFGHRQRAERLFGHSQHHDQCGSYGHGRGHAGYRALRWSLARTDRDRQRRHCALCVRLEPGRTIDHTDRGRNIFRGGHRCERLYESPGERRGGLSSTYHSYCHGGCAGRLHATVHHLQ
jgi:hypothetical protein